MVAALPFQVSGSGQVEGSFAQRYVKRHGLAELEALAEQAINAHPPEKVKSAIAKAHRAKTRRLRGVFAL
jgi:hypothetical protein